MNRGYVYVVESEEQLVKIGWSEQPGERVRQLESSHGDLHLWFVAPGTRTLERWLHSRWQHLRVHGEWFKADAELYDLLVEGTLLDRPGGLCRFGPSPGASA